MARICPVCLSDKTVFVSAGFDAAYAYLNGLCFACNSVWKERRGLRRGDVEQSEIELFAPTRESVMAQWQERLKAEASQTLLHDSEKAISHSHADGCPLCGSTHISLEVQGPGQAACSCLECGASWDHRYDAKEEQVYRGNIKPAEKGWHQLVSNLRKIFHKIGFVEFNKPYSTHQRTTVLLNSTKREAINTRAEIAVIAAPREDFSSNLKKSFHNCGIKRHVLLLSTKVDTATNGNTRPMGTIVPRFAYQWYAFDHRMPANVGIKCHIIFI
jgi:hypothetical protein